MSKKQTVSRLLLGWLSYDLRFVMRSSNRILSNIGFILAYKESYCDPNPCGSPKVSFDFEI